MIIFIIVDLTLNSYLYIGILERNIDDHLYLIHSEYTKVHYSSK